MKIKREEKALIKAYVNFMRTKYSICPNDADWLESEVTTIIGNKNMEYRYMVEEYITALIAMNDNKILPCGGDKRRRKEGKP